MTYIKNEWKDQKVERSKTYRTTKNDDGSITLIESFGLVEELGTPVDAARMGHIEEGIANCAIRKHSSDEVFTAGEWVLGSNGEDTAIFKSLTNDNQGNPLADSEHWEKALLNTGWGKITGDITNQEDLQETLDGEWVSTQYLISNTKIQGTYTIDISQYLPDDNCAHLILFSLFLTNSQGRNVPCIPYIQSSLASSAIAGNVYLNNTRSCGNFIFPVGTDKEIQWKITEGNATDCNLYMNAYRRLGKVK